MDIIEYLTNGNRKRKLIYKEGKIENKCYGILYDENNEEEYKGLLIIMEKVVYISKEKIKYYLMVFLKMMNSPMVYFIMMMEVSNMKENFLIILIMEKENYFLKEIMINII